MDDGNWTVSKIHFYWVNIHTNVSGTVTPTMHNSNGSENHTFITNFGQDGIFVILNYRRDIKMLLEEEILLSSSKGYQTLCPANYPQLPINLNHKNI